MNHQNYSFSEVFWGEDDSTQAQFRIATEMPEKTHAITSVMCAVFSDNKILLTKPPRGWGLPGGRVEAGESPVDAIKRECAEEGAVEIKNIRLVGFWEIKKIKELVSNQHYPETGYQLLFVADIETKHEFKAISESTDRRFVTPAEIAKMHHDFESFKEILRYLTHNK